ncbi:hypothetical protein Tco_0750380 [Tanacetum coccineum]|uniref:Uncharacterized protein n=1 Tax=Tanacetum coccineum TaxID=301880 RepID=A0ABQ4Z136_9ASTR
MMCFNFQVPDCTKDPDTVALCSRILLMLDVDTLQIKRRQKASESWLSHQKQSMLKTRSETKAAGTPVYHDSLKKLKNFADYKRFLLIPS